jgi:hypothetical protein
LRKFNTTGKFLLEALDWGGPRTLIDSLKPRQGEYFVWDGSLSGFGVRV